MASPLFCSALRFLQDMTLLCVKLHFGDISILSSMITTVESASTVRLDTGEEKKLIRSTDAKLVMEQLGLWDAEDGRIAEKWELMDGASVLLEEKEASLEEMEAAFAVFDEDRDGYICAEELREVMRKLGLEEGMELGDCRRMIGAFDEDGDGRIGVNEFKNLLGFAK